VFPERGFIKVTACRDIAQNELLGAWYFQDTALWWMGGDVRREVFEKDRGFLCHCSRCVAPDVCRTVICSKCNKQTSVPDGISLGSKAGQRAAPLTWRCSGCSSSGPGDPHVLNTEGDICTQVMTELRPRKGIEPTRLQELLALERMACERLGVKHWATAAANLVLHYKARAPDGQLDCFSVACGCRFVGFIIGHGLRLPPATIMRSPVAVATDCCAWFTGVGLAKGATAKARPGLDYRCFIGRLLEGFLLPTFRASGQTIAHIAGIGQRVAALEVWYEAFRGYCGCCSKPLAGSAGAPDDAAKPLTCGKCKQVRYCSRECQAKDWKARHKIGCMDVSEMFTSDAMVKRLIEDSTGT